MFKVDLLVGRFALFFDLSGACVDVGDTSPTSHMVDQLLDNDSKM
jgi:hypothetical protein